MYWDDDYGLQKLIIIYELGIPFLTNGPMECQMV